MAEEELIAFSATEMPTAETPDPPVKRVRSYMGRVHALFAVQWACHAMTLCIGLYMMRVEPARRDGENMGDAQLMPCICMAACASIMLILEETIWRHRVRAARDDVAKHREEAPVPHGAIPVPDSSTPFSSMFRIVRYVSFGFTAVLAGATFPGTSMMLAPETPAGHTLFSAHIISALSLIALGAMVVRHLAPYFGPGVTVFRDDPPEYRIALLAPIVAIIICDAVVFGAAVVAAARPRSMVSSITPLTRRELLPLRWLPSTPSEPGSSPPPAPPSPMPPSPMPPPPAVPAWMMTDVRGTMLGRIRTNPYGDNERDAMSIIATITTLANAAWLANTYFVALPEKVRQYLRVCVNAR